VLGVSRKIDEKNKEKDRLQKEIEKIRHARQELVDLGEKKLKVFSDNVGVLSGYWQCAMADAREIERWLKDGAKDAVRVKNQCHCILQLILSPHQGKPFYMKLSLEEAVQTCKWHLLFRRLLE
jgi:hypothetical protein